MEEEEGQQEETKTLIFLFTANKPHVPRKWLQGAS